MQPIRTFLRKCPSTVLNKIWKCAFVKLHKASIVPSLVLTREVDVSDFDQSDDCYPTQIISKPTPRFYIFSEIKSARIKKNAKRFERGIEFQTFLLLYILCQICVIRFCVQSNLC